MPAGPVYFVKPSRIAVIAASLTGSGVSKSGSPAAKLRTSTPFRLSWRARSSIPIVIDGVISRAALDRCITSPSGIVSLGGPSVTRRRPVVGVFAADGPLPVERPARWTARRHEGQPLDAGRAVV